ncbi:HNH endonuclease [Paenibacillus sp. UNC499MF]|uniref:HNH endonuclease n=1 Tax=Paenibacillus sp. UNC499MF TaxID=1502751 RepID=UPI0008A07CDB|nr:HNH endonuclease signature motif containing protein [Paenibacillus sp. UNC499MF]SEF66853.1 hypothetical protein SAMN02799616_00812 [Paenibacillus sp. UNC499MF]
MKNLFAFVLIITLVISLSSPMYAEQAPPYTTNDNQILEKEDKKAKEQLKALHQLGYLDKDYTNELLTNYEPEAIKKYKGNLEVLKQGTYLVAFDTKTKKQISDVQSIIEAGKTTSLISPQKSSLAFFSVKFYFVVGNPDTTSAEIVNTGTVTKCWGVGCPKEYEVRLKMLVSTNQSGYYGVYSQQSEDAKVLEDVVDIEKIYNTHFWKYDNIIYAEKDPNWPAGSESGGAFLLNRKGASYPLNYSDPQSGIKLYVPPTDLPINPIDRSSDYRSKFESHYVQSWGNPYKFSWNQVEIHHMKPLKYGGSNDVYNLIPLMNYNNSSSSILKHSQLTSWWASY